LDIRPPFGSAETEKIDDCDTLAITATGVGAAGDTGVEAAPDWSWNIERKSTAAGGLPVAGFADLCRIAVACVGRSEAVVNE